MTIPVNEPTVAIVVALLVQVPPVTASLSVAVDPMHIIAVPVIADGTGFTVTVFVAIQPLAVA